MSHKDNQRRRPDTNDLTYFEEKFRRSTIIFHYQDTESEDGESQDANTINRKQLWGTFGTVTSLEGYNSSSEVAWKIIVVEENTIKFQVELSINTLGVQKRDPLFLMFDRARVPLGQLPLNLPVLPPRAPLRKKNPRAPQPPASRRESPEVTKALDPLNDSITEEHDDATESDADMSTENDPEMNLLALKTMNLNLYVTSLFPKTTTIPLTNIPSAKPLLPLS